MYLQFQATDEQLQQIAANAVNHSHPMGMGVFHFKEEHMFKPEDFRISNGLNLDYVEGRMVKLRIAPLRAKGEGWFQTVTDLSSDYQSWFPHFKSIEELLTASGVSVETALRAESFE